MNPEKSRYREVGPDSITVAAQCFGVPIGVRCRRMDAEAVAAHLPLGYKLISPTENTHLFILATEPHDNALYSIKRGRSRRVSSAQSLGAALKSLQKEIHLCVAEHTSSHVFVHAGVILWKNHTIVFPGSSYAGKSTLVWAFVQAGAIYYSDEYAVFDEEGYVQPFALPISLRAADGNRRMVTPATVGSDRRRPDFILFAQYRAGAVWSARRMPPASAVMGLIQHSIAIRRHPELVIPVLKQVSLQAQAFVGVRGESEQLLQWIGLFNGCTSRENSIDRV